MKTFALAAALIAARSFAQEETPAPVPAAAAAEPAPAPAPEPTPPVAAIAPCPASTTVLPQPQSGCAPSVLMRVARIGVEVVLGGALGSLGELIGIYAGLNADILAGHEGSLGLSVGATLGALVSVGPSVWLGGRAMGGDGSFGWTMLGSAAGTALSAIVLAIKNNMATMIIAAVLPVAGATVGYELSSNAKRPAPQGVSITPTIGPGSVGLAGVF